MWRWFNYLVKNLGNYYCIIIVNYLKHFAFIILYMKCDLCKNEIEESFLEKIKGAYFKIEGRKKVACSECQRKYKDKLKDKL